MANPITSSSRSSVTTASEMRQASGLQQKQVPSGVADTKDSQLPQKSDADSAPSCVAQWIRSAKHAVSSFFNWIFSYFRGPREEKVPSPEPKQPQSPQAALETVIVENPVEARPDYSAMRKEAAKQLGRFEELLSETIEQLQGLSVPSLPTAPNSITEPLRHAQQEIAKSLPILKSVRSLEQRALQSLTEDCDAHSQSVKPEHELLGLSSYLTQCKITINATLQDIRKSLQGVTEDEGSVSLQGTKLKAELEEVQSAYDAAAQAAADCLKKIEQIGAEISDIDLQTAYFVQHSTIKERDCLEERLCSLFDKTDRAMDVPGLFASQKTQELVEEGVKTFISDVSSFLSPVAKAVKGSLPKKWSERADQGLEGAQALAKALTPDFSPSPRSFKCQEEFEAGMNSLFVLIGKRRAQAANAEQKERLQACHNDLLALLTAVTSFFSNAKCAADSAQQKETLAQIAAAAQKELRVATSAQETAAQSLESAKKKLDPQLMACVERQQQNGSIAQQLRYKEANLTALCIDLARLAAAVQETLFSNEGK